MKKSNNNLSFLYLCALTIGVASATGSVSSGGRQQSERSWASQKEIAQVMKLARVYYKVSNEQTITVENNIGNFYTATIVDNSITYVTPYKNGVMDIRNIPLKGNYDFTLTSDDINFDYPISTPPLFEGNLVTSLKLKQSKPTQAVLHPCREVHFELEQGDKIRNDVD